MTMECYCNRASSLEVLVGQLVLARLSALRYNTPWTSWTTSGRSKTTGAP